MHINNNCFTSILNSNMVRAPYVDNKGIRKGAWSQEEDDLLRAHVERFGHSNWRALPKFAGLSRCGKSCRLRWMNYLRPGVKHGNYSKQEEDLIIQLHNRFGNKWSKIAEKLPGRTDNEIKNYWHTNLKEKTKRRSSNNNVMKDKYTSKNSEYIPRSPPILESSSYCSNASCDSATEVGVSNTNWTTEDSQTSFESTCQVNSSSDFDHFWSQPFVTDQHEYGFRIPNLQLDHSIFPSFEDSIDLFYQIMRELPPI